MRAMAFRFCGTVIAMPVAAWLLPGVHTQNAETAWLCGLFLGVIYVVLRPFAKLLLIPLNCLSFGILGFILDVGLVSLAARWMPGFTVDGFWWAAAASLIASFLREGLGSIAKKRS